MERQLARMPDVWIVPSVWSRPLTIFVYTETRSATELAELTSVEWVESVWMTIHS